MSSRFSVEAIFKAIDRFTAPVTAMQNRLGKFTRAMDSSFKSVNKTINSVAGSLWGAGKTILKWGAVAIAGTTAGIIELVSQYSKIEDATAAFTPLLGGADKARQLVDALNQAAADTPFRFNDLSDAAKQLLPVMNGDITKTIDTIKMLGDTAGGNAQKLESITHGFTKAMLKGKVDMESLNMIGEAGVPIFTELANSMGKKVNPAFFKMISAGKVTTAQLTKAFVKMTSAGGIFFKGMDIASQTTSGLWSTLQDNISLTAASLGEVLAPTIKELIVGATDIAQQIRAWVGANKEFIRTKFIEYVNKIKTAFQDLVARFSDVSKSRGAFDQLLSIITSIGTGIIWLASHGEQIGKLVEWIIILTVTFKVLAGVMAIVNLVMTANPIGLIIVAIGLAIAAIAAIIIYWDDLVAAFDRLPEWVKTAGAIFLAPLFAIVAAIKLGIQNWDAFIDRLKTVGKWLGIVDDSNVNVTTTPQTTDPNFSMVPPVVSPQERNAQALNESRTTSYAELLIRDSTGKAELSKSNSPNIGFSMVPSGAF